MHSGRDIDLKLGAEKLDGNAPVVNGRSAPVFTRLVPSYSSQCIMYWVDGYMPATRSSRFVASTAPGWWSSKPSSWPGESEQAADGPPCMAAR